ncbi:hypothetical protein [Oceanobacillus damuensis]|uniref:hypothetical protein n=1 Tax=Oceanobacillus damuensis TaxID=937928 RepID=UPI0008357B96|nr:hypothetical protein [Oceanobacillus damuensis]
MIFIQEMKIKIHRKDLHSRQTSGNNSVTMGNKSFVELGDRLLKELDELKSYAYVGDLRALA